MKENKAKTNSHGTLLCEVCNIALNDVIHYDKTKYHFCKECKGMLDRNDLMRHIK